jgi:predicted dehydrogenase
MNKKIRIGIVGTGGMAHAHARDIQRNRHVKLVAVADVFEAKAREFAATHGVTDVFTSQTDLLKKVDVDAMINVTPDAYHAALTLEALAAGKHVLCEKPLATNATDARRMAVAAKKTGVVNMVNFSYRNSAAIQRAHAMVQRGDLGRPMHFEASYLQSWLSTQVWGDWRSAPGWLWRLSSSHGSLGVLGDVGVHILDFAAYPLGPYASVNCRLKTFDKAKGGKIGDYTLDANDSAVIHAEMKNGALGVVHTSRWATGQKNSLVLRIYGEEGALVVDLDKGYSRLDVCLGKARHKAEWKTIECAKTPTNFERFVRWMRTGKPDQPDFVQGAAIQAVIDACVKSDKTGRNIVC